MRSAIDIPAIRRDKRLLSEKFLPDIFNRSCIAHHLAVTFPDNIINIFLIRLGIRSSWTETASEQRFRFLVHRVRRNGILFKIDIVDRRIFRRQDINDFQVLFNLLLMHTYRADQFILVGKANHESFLPLVDGNDLAFAELVRIAHKLKTRDALLLQERIETFGREFFQHGILIFRSDNFIDDIVNRTAISKFTKRIAKHFLDGRIQLMRSHQVVFQITIENTRIVRCQKRSHSGIFIHALSAVDFVFGKTRDELQDRKVLLRFLGIVQNEETVALFIWNNRRYTNVLDIQNR